MDPTQNQQHVPMQYLQAQPPMFLSQTGAIMYQQANLHSPSLPPQGLQHGLIYYQPVPYYQYTPYMIPKTQNLTQSTPIITHSAQPVIFSSQEKPKKKKPSPSAKRRSRLRLMAFLEQKKKAAAENGEEQEPNQRSKSPDEGCDIDEKT